ncbi:MAG TPA: hypothetical protein ENN67_08890 [Firmicutes bacterium]|nr:hypothetical protein [Bacillota bacterium]
MPDGITQEETPEIEGGKTDIEKSEAEGEKQSGQTAEPVTKTTVKRLRKSVGMGLPSNRYRVFLGRGAIPPVSESKTFVAPLKKVDRLDISIYEGDGETIDQNVFVGEIGVNGIKLREDGKAEIEITFSLDMQGVLQVTISDKRGGIEGTSKYVLGQFSGAKSDTIDFGSLPVEELSQKIDLLEQQMDLLKGELTVRRERK